MFERAGVSCFLCTGVSGVSIPEGACDQCWSFSSVTIGSSSSLAQMNVDILELCMLFQVFQRAGSCDPAISLITWKHGKYPLCRSKSRM